MAVSASTIVSGPSPLQSQRAATCVSGTYETTLMRFTKSLLHRSPRRASPPWARCPKTLSHQAHHECRSEAAGVALVLHLWAGHDCRHQSDSRGIARLTEGCLSGLSRVVLQAHRCERPQPCACLSRHPARKKPPNKTPCWRRRYTCSQRSGRDHNCPPCPPTGLQRADHPSLGSRVLSGRRGHLLHGLR
jgi:hypothetical protein